MTDIEKAPQSEEAVKTMTAETVGHDLLSALLDEIKLLPDVWGILAKAEQDEIIYRLSARVRYNVGMAVELVAGAGQKCVKGKLEQITIKDGVKAVLTFNEHCEHMMEFYASTGHRVLVVMSDPESHMAGIDEIKGESDQRALGLGHEYDPKSDGKGVKPSK